MVLVGFGWLVWVMFVIVCKVWLNLGMKWLNMIVGVVGNGVWCDCYCKVDIVWDIVFG